MRRVMAWLLATWLLAWRDEPDVYDEVHGDVVIVPMVSRPFADSEGGRR